MGIRPGGHGHCWNWPTDNLLTSLTAWVAWVTYARHKQHEQRFTLALELLIVHVSPYVVPSKSTVWHYNMSLVTCSKVFRPWLNLFRSAAGPARFNECRRFIFLQKPSHFVSGPSRHRSKGNPHRKSGWHSCDFGLTSLVLLTSAFAANLALFVSMLNILFVFYLALLLCPYAVNDHFRTKNT